MSDCHEFDNWWAENFLTVGMDVKPKYRTSKTAYDAFKAGMAVGSCARAEDMRRRCEEVAVDATRHLSIRHPTELIVKAIRSLTPTSNFLAVAEAKVRVDEARWWIAFISKHRKRLATSPINWEALEKAATERVADLKRLEATH